MGDKYKVLVVDDQAKVLESLAEFLELKGFTPILAGTAADGLGELLRSGPDVVLMDTYLGNFKGYDVCRMMRNIRPHTPIIGISSYPKSYAPNTGGPTLEQLWTRSGAYKFLSKEDMLPDPTQYVTELTNAIEQYKSPKQSVLHAS